MGYLLFQITFFISVSSFTSVGADKQVSACVPNNDRSGKCRDVFYYLSKTDHADCHRVCKFRGMRCTAVNHGFNDTTVLEIFASILGHTCRTGYNDYTTSGPAYFTPTGVKSYCTKWKDIPEKISCKTKPRYQRMLRLCPCVESPDNDPTQTPTCAEALGMENGVIPDRNIQASSVYQRSQTTKHAAAYGRLNFNTKGKAGAWSADTNDQNQWLQVDFGTGMVVSGVATQGRQDVGQWVKSYSLSYSVDGRTFYRNNKTFTANTDRNTVVKHTLPTTIVARYVRIHPRTWKSYISMRAELYGCKPDNKKFDNEKDKTTHTQPTQPSYEGIRPCSGTGDIAPERTFSQPILTSTLFDKDKVLADHVIDTAMVSSVEECSRKCFNNRNCVSINFEYLAQNMKTCEINNSTKEIAEESFVNRHGFVYYG